ncbi:hypothetical protein D3C78_1226730 [compost metagenome]
MAHGGIGLAAVGEAGSQDVAAAGRLAIDHFFLVDHFEFVAFADVEGEVDVVTEDVRKVHGQFVRQPGTLGGNEQRAVDGAVGIGLANGRLDQFALDAEALGGAGDMHAFQSAQA